MFATAPYDECLVEFEAAMVRAERLAAEELARTRTLLTSLAATKLTSALLFASPEVEAGIQRVARGADLEAPRNQKVKSAEHLVLSYVQRLAAKNDTIGEYGPTGWARVEARDGFSFVFGEPWIRERVTYLEKWVSDGFAAAISADADALPSLCPRRHPNLGFVQDRWIRMDLDRELELTPQQVQLLNRCDGSTRAEELDPTLEDLRGLQACGALVWEMEPPHVDAHRFDAILEQLRTWESEPARSRWLPRAERLEQLRRKFHAAHDPELRREAVREAELELHELGIQFDQDEMGRNAISQDCRAELEMGIPRGAADNLVSDIAPWLGLWRDTLRYASTRIAALLTERFRQAQPRGDRMPLPRYLALWEADGRPLTERTLNLECKKVFAEVRTLFRNSLGSHSQPEIELRPEDCALLSQHFDLPDYEEQTLPSLDLQIAAPSTAAFERGEVTWVVSELHAREAFFPHALMWAAPEPEALGRWVASAAQGPTCAFGQRTWEVCNHVERSFPFRHASHAYVWAGVGKVSEGWSQVPPWRVDVVLGDRDVRLRDRETDADLGSLARQISVAQGPHPFFFELGVHTPRFRIGSVVVQRRCWIVEYEALKALEEALGPRAAIEAFREDLGLPRFLFAKPLASKVHTLRGIRVASRLKPFLVDLESLLLTELFVTRLRRSGRMRLTEMLPAPDELVLERNGDHYTFELRGIVAPPPP